jgi:anti-sigma factor RsiW
MRICKLFDRYRDGELNSAERNQYESHLAACEDCRARMSLLNNLVRFMKAEEVRPLDLADRIAQQAFERGRSWDFEVLTWLRPGPALAALTLVIALFSSLLIVSSNRQVIADSEFEKLMENADAVSLSARLSQVRSENELILWLEQEGNTSD